MMRRPESTPPNTADAATIICMRSQVNDRCGPHYTAVFDHDYDKIAPWANVVSSGTVMPDALTDAAVRLFASEEKNREHRVEKAEHENKNNEGENRR